MTIKRAARIRKENRAFTNYYKKDQGNSLGGLCCAVLLDAVKACRREQGAVIWLVTSDLARDICEYLDVDRIGLLRTVYLDQNNA